jgi:hypothetical protein
MKLLDFINQSLEKNLSWEKTPLRCGSTSFSERQYSILSNNAYRRCEWLGYHLEDHCRVTCAWPSLLISVLCLCTQISSEVAAYQAINMCV